MYVNLICYTQKCMNLQDHNPETDDWMSEPIWETFGLFIDHNGKPFEKAADVTPWEAVPYLKAEDFEMLLSRMVAEYNSRCAL